MNGTLHTIDGRPLLRFERRFAHSVDRVWRAITDPDDLRHWFPGVPDWTLEAGSTFTVHGDAGGDGRITELDPPRLLAFDWREDRLRFELEADGDGDGCRLTFTHAFADRAVGARTAAGWEVCLDRMDAQMHGAPVGEKQSLEAWPALHERYAEDFGLDPEVGRQTFAQHSTQA
jgi:uncharacterized protein YndB with AHSA1/START domain